jgi:hypothetical protein
MIPHTQAKCSRKETCEGRAFEPDGRAPRPIRVTLESLTYEKSRQAKA